MDFQELGLPFWPLDFSGFCSQLAQVNGEVFVLLFVLVLPVLALYLLEKKRERHLMQMIVIILLAGNRL